MIQVPLYNMAGELQEEIELDEARLGGEVRYEVMRQAVLTYEANQRTGNAKTKTRSETSYSNAKPWPQKHTGRARAGSRNSPIWVGGAVTFGPQPRDYSKKLNKKMRRRAVASALLGKLQSGEVKILDELELPQPKTREMARVLENLGVERTFLIVLPEHDKMLWRCTRNIPGSSMMASRELNAYRLLRPRDVIFTRAAFDMTVQRIEEQFGVPTPQTADTTEGE
jgi:large subunit ribosomal protein L4